MEGKNTGGEAEYFSFAPLETEDLKMEVPNEAFGGCGETEAQRARETKGRSQGGNQPSQEQP